jgi:UDP-glucose 4-epimerase
MSDRILVTGAAGFVGQHLVDRLVENGHFVTALDIEHNPELSYSDSLGEDVEYLRGSILNRQFIDNVVFPGPSHYDRVFHLAAIVGVNRYVDPDNPLYLVNVNVNGTRHLLDRVRGTDTRFVYTSTSEIYGKNPNVPWHEEADQLLGPTSISRWSYSATKTVSEQMIQMLDANGEITASIVRPFNLYGPYQRPKFVIPKFVEMALDNEAPTVYGDGIQQRCFTYVKDFVEGIVAASKRDPAAPRVYNLGNTTETAIGDLAEMVIEAVGLDADPTYVDPEDAHDGDYEQPTRRVPDTSRAAEYLDWEATTPLEEGLKRTVASKRGE